MEMRFERGFAKPRCREYYIRNMNEGMKFKPVVGAKKNPDGSMDYSHAATLHINEEEERKKMAERLKIPESVKPGTLGMVFMRLSNAEILATDPAKKMMFARQVSEIAEMKRQGLSLDQVYDILQEWIDGNEENTKTYPENAQQNESSIKEWKDLQILLLDEGRNNAK